MIITKYSIGRSYNKLSYEPIIYFASFNRIESSERPKSCPNVKKGSDGDCFFEKWQRKDNSNINKNYVSQRSILSINAEPRNDNLAYHNKFAFNGMSMKDYNYHFLCICMFSIKYVLSILAQGSGGLEIDHYWKEMSQKSNLILLEFLL